MGDITPFAESLLADTRKRNRQRQKEAERADRTAFLTKIGLGLAKKVGNELLAQQTEKFMNSTEFKAARQVARQGDNIQSTLQKEIDQIRASDQDPINYLIEQLKPSVENELASETPYKDRGTSNYEATIYKGARQLAEERWRILTEAEKIWQDQNLDENEQRVLLTAKNYRPETITDYLTSKLTSFVSGRDGQDADMREMLALEDFIQDQDPSSRGYWIKKLKLLNDEYNKSGDLNKANAYARGMMATMGPPSDETFEEENDLLVKGDNNAFFTKRITTTYRYKPDGTREQVGQPSEKLVRGEDGSPEIVDMRSEAERVGAAMKMFNYDDFIDKNFKGEAKAAFMSTLVDTAGKPLGEIDTFEEYKIFSNAFYTFASRPESYVMESEGLEFFKQSLAEWHKTEGVRLQAVISKAEAEGRDQTQAQMAYMTALAQVGRDLQQQAYNITPELRPINLVVENDEEDVTSVGYSIGATRQR